MKQTIEMILDGVKWVPVEYAGGGSDNDGPPYATHKGVLNLMGSELVCYQLSDGTRVFDAESLERFFSQKR